MGKPHDVIEHEIKTGHQFMTRKTRQAKHNTKKVKLMARITQQEVYSGSTGQSSLIGLKVLSLGLAATWDG